MRSIRGAINACRDRTYVTAEVELNLHYTNFGVETKAAIDELTEFVRINPEIKRINLPRAKLSECPWEKLEHFFEVLQEREGLELDLSSNRLGNSDIFPRIIAQLARSKVAKLDLNNNQLSHFFDRDPGGAAIFFSLLSNPFLRVLDYQENDFFKLPAEKLHEFFLRLKDSRVEDVSLMANSVTSVDPQLLKDWVNLLISSSNLHCLRIDLSELAETAPEIVKTLIKAIFCESFITDFHGDVKYLPFFDPDEFNELLAYIERRGIIQVLDFDRQGLAELIESDDRYQKALVDFVKHGTMSELWIAGNDLSVDSMHIIFEAAKENPFLKRVIYKGNKYNQEEAAAFEVYLKAKTVTESDTETYVSSSGATSASSGMS